VAAEELVVMRDFVDTSRCNASAAQHVLEERPHIGQCLWTAKGDHQHGVKGL
jgi:hypothetical protein